MPKDELESLNAELIALLTAIRNQIDETLDGLTDDDDADDLGEFEDDELGDED